MKYSCYIDNKELTVYPAHVSAIPFNTVWPGHQRTIAHTEEAYFISFDMTEPVTLTVNVEDCEIERVDIGPQQFDIPCERLRKTFTLKIKEPIAYFS